LGAKIKVSKKYINNYLFLKTVSKVETMVISDEFDWHLTGNGFTRATPTVDLFYSLPDAGRPASKK
jgi:hypothetical protein